MRDASGVEISKARIPGVGIVRIRSSKVTGRVQARVKGKRVGNMQLSTSGPDVSRIYAQGEVMGIGVTEKMRRKGVATAMWRHAEKTNMKPIHSPIKTPDGEAWAKTVSKGLKVPPGEGGGMNKDVVYAPGGFHARPKGKHRKIEKRDAFGVKRTPPKNHREEIIGDVTVSNAKTNQAHIRTMRAWKRRERAGIKDTAPAKARAERRAWRAKNVSPKTQKEIRAQRAKRDIAIPANLAATYRKKEKLSPAAAALKDFDSGKKMTNKTPKRDPKWASSKYPSAGGYIINDGKVIKGLPSYLRSTPKGVLSPGLKLRVTRHESGRVMSRNISRSGANPPKQTPAERSRQLTLFERDGSTTYNARRRKKP